MNPILEDILAFISDRRKITRIELGPIGNRRRKIGFVFAEGAGETRFYDYDRATFLEWWAGAAGYLRSSAEAMAEVAKQIEATE